MSNAVCYVQNELGDVCTNGCPVFSKCAFKRTPLLVQTLSMKLDIKINPLSPREATSESTIAVMEIPVSEFRANGYINNLVGYE